MRTETPSNPVSLESLARKHEAGQPSLQNPMIVAASVMVMIAGCIGSAGGLIHEFSRHRPMQWMPPLGIIAAPDLKPLNRFPKPELEIDDGHGDWVVLHSRQQELLNSYGWVDRSNGVVRIPINRALDLIAQKGFRSFDGGRSNAISPVELMQKRPSQR
jgi:hypothetical protein